MKASDLKKRLRKDRPSVSVHLQMPEDVLGDLQKIAAFQGISSPEALMCQYILPHKCANAIPNPPDQAEYLDLNAN